MMKPVGRVADQQSSFTGAAMAAGMLVAPGIAHADTQASHFIWTATSSNTSGNATLINNLATDGEPGALLFVTPNFDPGGVNGGYDNSPIGVYYDSSAGTSGEHFVQRVRSPSSHI